jgi:hypothetical protein
MDCAIHANGNPGERFGASHAVLINGFLMPVGDLVNGTSIVLETADGQEALDFFHIELEHHDVIDAAGAPCESLRHPAVEPCVPLLGFNGGRSELRSRVRSALSPIINRREPLDVIRDRLEERMSCLVRTAGSSLVITAHYQVSKGNLVRWHEDGRG